MTSPLLPQLRQATSESHRRLDDHISVDWICESRRNYQDYLTRFLRATQQVSSRFAWDLLASVEFPDLAERRGRYQNLAENLSRLTGDESRSSPFSAADAEVSLGEVVGVFYVLEGSVHGGRQICRALRANVPDLDDEHLSFLAGFGDETGGYWGRFVRWLEGLTLTESQQAAACQTAVEVFTTFESQFAKDE